MKISTILTFVLTAALLSACGSVTINGISTTIQGSGKMTTETRNVSGFTEVQVTNSGEMTITQGDVDSLKIEAEDNILPILTSEVTKGRLVIGAKLNASYRATRTIRYTITVKDLSAVETNGSANISVAGLTTNGISLTTTGSGNIVMVSATVKTLKAQTTGSGNITVNGGKADSINAQSTGSGNFNAPNLEAQTASASTNGSGNITLWAKTSLKAMTTGSGSIYYYGAPIVDQTVTGSGRVTSKGAK